MMTFDEVLKTRRSIRQYAEGEISKDDIIRIITFAQYAPSWKNSQTARYYAVVSPEKVKAFADECLPEGNRTKADNAALIVVTFVKNRSGFDKDGMPSNECGQGWGYFDLGCACQNLCLKAHEMGYGTLIMGLRCGEKIRKFLSLPKEEQLVAVIALGHPAASPEIPPRLSTSEVLKFI